MSKHLFDRRIQGKGTLQNKIVLYQNETIIVTFLDFVFVGSCNTSKEI